MATCISQSHSEILLNTRYITHEAHDTSGWQVVVHAMCPIRLFQPFTDTSTCDETTPPCATYCQWSTPPLLGILPRTLPLQYSRTLKKIHYSVLFCSDIDFGLHGNGNSHECHIGDCWSVFIWKSTFNYCTKLYFRYCSSRCANILMEDLSMFGAILPSLWCSIDSWSVISHSHSISLPIVSGRQSLEFSLDTCLRNAISSDVA